MPDCDNHAATVTAPIHAALGPWVCVTEPVTVCCTCHATVTLPEPEEPK